MTDCNAAEKNFRGRIPGEPLAAAKNEEINTIMKRAPKELRESPQWVGWRSVPKPGGKADKIPVDPESGDFTSVDDPATWDMFERAARCYIGRESVAGVGYVFSEADPYAGIDLDDCVDPETGEIKEWAAMIVERAGTYAEISPSGKGVKLFGKGTLPVGVNKNGVEAYSSGRFFTVTGRQIEGTPSEARNIQPALDAIWEKYSGASGDGYGSRLDVASILAGVPEGERDTALFKLACKFRNADVPEEYAKRLVLEAAANCDPPFDPDVAAEKVHRAYRKYDPGVPSENGDVRDQVDPTRGAATSKAKDDAKAEGSAADRLVAYTLAEGVELFCDQNGAPHLLDGTEPIPLTSSAYKYLRRLMWKHEGKVVARDALQGAVGTLAAFASDSGRVRELHTRAAFADGTLYYELGPGHYAVVSAGGWHVAATVPVLFRRIPNLLELPEPERGGSLSDGEFMVNLKGERDKRLFGAYVVLAPLPHISRPILLTTGAMGSGKTTANRYVKKLLDPTKPEMVRMDKRGEFLQKASHCFLIMLDNETRMPEWASDTICRLTTGEADSKRVLYSDDDDIIYEMMRALLVNGINVPTDRTDFLDRSLAVELERVEKRDRVPESKLWERFSEVHPKLLGAVFDGLSATLRALPETHPDELPRLADWGRFASAYYAACGHGARTFAADWAEVERAQNLAAYDGSPLAQAIIVFMHDKTEWRGTATNLHRGLERAADAKHLDIDHDPAWPRTGRTLWRGIRELVGVLDAAGIVAKREHTRAGSAITLFKGRDDNVMINWGCDDNSGVIVTGNPALPRAEASDCDDVTINAPNRSGTSLGGYEEIAKWGRTPPLLYGNAQTSSYRHRQANEPQVERAAEEERDERLRAIEQEITDIEKQIAGVVTDLLADGRTFPDEAALVREAARVSHADEVYVKSTIGKLKSFSLVDPDAYTLCRGQEEPLLRPNPRKRRDKEHLS